MKVGDLVRSLEAGPRRFGLVIDLIDDIEVPPVCVILYASGNIEKEWSDEVEVFDEHR